MRSGPENAVSKSMNPTVAAILVFMGMFACLSLSLLLSLQPLNELVVKAILKYIWMFLGIGVLVVLVLYQLLDRKAIEPEDDNI